MCVVGFVAVECVEGIAWVIVSVVVVECVVAGVSIDVGFVVV